MALIIEDGTGVDNANSYATVAELYTYASERGQALSVSNEAAEALLIKAMDYIEGKFGQRWQGVRSNSAQALAWPREGVWLDGVAIEANEIPRNLLYGQLSAAVEAVDNELQPNVAPAVKREKVGDLEVEYTNSGKRYAVSAFAKPDALLRPLCVNRGLVLATRA